jgi:hypothetical protein
MVNELREVFERGRKSERSPVVSVEKCKADTELKQQPVHPLLHLEGVLHFCLFRNHSCQHHRSCLLVEPLAQLCELVLSKVFEADS